MSKIRNNLPLVAVVIAVAILAFTVQDSLSRIVGGGSTVNEVGEVAGVTIEVQEFNERYLTQLNNQRPAGAPALTDIQRNQVLDQAWNQMVSEIIYEKELGKVGLEITGAEMADIFTGRNLSPFVRNYFEPYFQSQGQQFTGAAVRDYIQTLQQQGTMEQKQSFKDFETGLREYRAQERFNNMVKAGFVASDAMAKKSYMDKSRTFSISYLNVPFSAIPDSTVELSDSDFREYIDEYEYRYKQDAQTQIRYVVFNITPNASDSAAARNELLRDQERFKEALSDSTFTIGKTRTPYNNQLVAISEVSPLVQREIVNASAGDLFGPYLERDGYYKLFKLVETEAAEESWAKIRHRVVFFGTDTTAAREEAASLLRTARSQGMDSVDNVIELGWYRKGSMGTDFDEKVSSASKGSIIGPIKSNQGWHVVEILDKTNRRFGVANIENQIIYDDPTKDAVDKEASVLAAKAMSMNSIEAAASEEGLVSYPSQALSPETPATTTLTGVQEGSREIITWALKAEEGEFSEIFESGDAFVFAQVTSKTNEGVQGVDDLKGSIRPLVLNEKKTATIKERLAQIGGSDLNAMMSSYNQQFGGNATIGNASDITFNSNSISGIPGSTTLIGTVTGLDQGQVSGPVAAAMGVYVVKVDNITEPGEPDPTLLATEKGTLNVNKQGELSRRIESAMRELADIKDQRYKAGF
jgi:peptidyl-prolyl cis-trans isomerase D